MEEIYGLLDQYPVSEINQNILLESPQTWHTKTVVLSFLPAIQRCTASVHGGSI